MGTAQAREAALSIIPLRTIPPLVSFGDYISGYLFVPFPVRLLHGAARSFHRSAASIRISRPPFVALLADCLRSLARRARAATSPDRVQVCTSIWTDASIRAEGQRTRFVRETVQSR